MSELDDDHKKRLLTFVREDLEQVFITTTKTNIKDASVYEVSQHIVTRRNAKW